LRYAIFPGCVAQTEQYGCELSAREVLPRLDVELVELEGAGCCGFLSFRNLSPIGWKYMTARNLALAEKLGLDILTLCNCCHMSFCKVKKDMEADRGLEKMIAETLSIEGLEYGGGTEVHHILEVLHDLVGIDEIAAHVTRPLRNVDLASHPGCYAFRPKGLDRPDEGEDPKKLENLIMALGADSSNYNEKLSCCGSSLSYADGTPSLRIAGLKLKAVKDRGFNGLVTVCPVCFKVFDSNQPAIRSLMGEEVVDVPVFYYTQLLGLSMGISTEKLGLHLNLSPVEGFLTHV
jgi:heterodisulfide reductase subunit B